jgi:phage gp29-like protein
MKKLWLSENKFVELSEPLDSLSTEISTRERVGEIWASFFGTIENPDPVLRRTGQSIAAFDEIRRDPQVSTCITGRQAGVQKLKWRIEQNDASEKAVEVITDIFKSFKMHSLLRETMNAVFYGYEVQEVVWAVIDGYVVPVKIEEKPHEWFAFDYMNILQRREAGFDNWVNTEPRKFLLTRNNATYKNPYGEGLLSMCFWPVTFKKGGIKFWAVFLEKFGMPHAIGKLPRGASHTDRSTLLSALNRMVRDACAVFPDDSSVELVESMAKGASSDLYEKHAKYHDGEISKVILGHSAAADATPGRLGGEDSSLTVREDLVDSDCTLVTETFNELIKWIHELNPTLGKELPTFVLYEKENVDTTLAERDDIIGRNGKVRFTKKYYIRAYGYTDDDIIVDETATPAQAQFSEPDPIASAGNALEALISAVPNSELQTQMENILKPIFELRDTCSSFEEFREGLFELYPEMDTSGVEKIMENSGLLSAVWGRLNSIE